MIPSTARAPGAEQLTPQQVADEQAMFLRKVYAYMGAGLLMTALTAFLVASSPSARELIFGHRAVFYGLLGAEFLMVLAFSSMAQTMSASGAASLFFLYAITNGLTLSVIFLVYTKSSIALTFVVTAGTFLGMSVYGYVTKRDLTGVGNFLIMLLWGLILDYVVCAIFHISTSGLVTTAVGIVIFVGLTAYDTQRILRLNIIGNAGTDEDTKEAIHGALVLYLDFINLFLQLLKLLGNRK